MSMNPFDRLHAQRLSRAERYLRENPDVREMLAGNQALQAASPIENEPRSGTRERQWPAPLASQAFHGIAGEIIRTIEPHTEADPAALLIQFLAGFGNLIGRGTYTTVEADRHGCNLFVALVGMSAKGRKGTALGHVRRILEQVDATWAAERIQSGLSSGEGLIWGVRDPILKKEVLVDPGVLDKRLLIVESELSSTLRVMGREGSTPSPLIRQAWDTGDLRVLPKIHPRRLQEPTFPSSRISPAMN
jgi:hypothetical protein